MQLPAHSFMVPHSKYIALITFRDFNHREFQKANEFAFT